jgi:hypothetical protein
MRRSSLLLSVCAAIPPRRVFRPALTVSRISRPVWTVSQVPDDLHLPI